MAGSSIAAGSDRPPWSSTHSWTAVRLAARKAAATIRERSGSPSASGNRRLSSAAIARISDYQTTIASAVEEQTATTAEMSRSVNEAASGAGSIAENITGVAEAAHLTSQGVTQSQQATNELARMSSELTALVGNFHY